MENIKICVVGLGYVGLPLACLLSKHFNVSGFDIDDTKIEELKSGHDRTDEVGENLKNYLINYSSQSSIIKEANFVIVAVPTPIDENNEPDLSLVEKATTLVGQNLGKDTIVVYESTVYPGVTEDICVPILAQESSFKFNSEFSVGYSPERVNPGDKEHTIDKIYKVISASNNEALVIVEKVYSTITKIHKSPNIKTAEAAKVIENIQRDLNIALMNELSLIFEKMDIDTKDVIEVAGTKWNFVKYTPGLVGGHCISVDPYYLTFKAEQLGYKSQVILAGRSINDNMAKYVAGKLIKELNGKKKVLIMGLSFKENVPDLRNSKALDIKKHLEKENIEVVLHDPLVKNKYIISYFGKDNSSLDSIEKQDAIIMFSPHNEFKEITLSKLKDMMTEKPILFDLKRFYDRKEAQSLGINYLFL